MYLLLFLAILLIRSHRGVYYTRAYKTRHVYKIERVLSIRVDTHLDVNESIILLGIIVNTYNAFIPIYNIAKNIIVYMHSISFHINV